MDDNEIDYSEKPNNLIKENKMESAISGLTINYASVIAAFILAPIVAILICIGYNKIVEDFGFLQTLVSSNQIPNKLSYLTGLGFCWASVGIRSLFVKGA